MLRPASVFRLSALLTGLFTAACSGPPAASKSAGRSHADLLAFFQEWRAFQKPRLIDGVPDYSPRAMAAQHRELAGFQQRLAAFDTSGWTIEQQVDLRLVQAELNGLDFDQRVLRPWANNPAFYVTVFPSESDQPLREGPHAEGSLELWSYAFPYDAAAESEIAARLRTIPGLLAQARGNLVGNGRDLWHYGTESVLEQREALGRLAARLADSAAQSPLRLDVLRAEAATDSFVTWLDAQLPSRTGPSGIGVANYDWYLRNVQLLPYTWQQQVALMERELARAYSYLALEEKRNAALPQQSLVSSPEEHSRRFNDAITDYLKFLNERQILTVKEYMDPALRARIGRFSTRPREFFTEVNYRDPSVMRTHDYHWFDKAWLKAEAPANPIRNTPLLYNIFITRTEGLATAWEELMLQAGMFDNRPRSRELIYILVAERAARALGDLRMHSNEFTLEQAAEFTSANTPRGWLSLKGNLVRAEQHLYLQQPSYGTSYVIGKIEIDQLIADRAREQGERFTLKSFMDEFNAAGLIPISMIRWQITWPNATVATASGLPHARHPWCGSSC